MTTFREPIDTKKRNAKIWRLVKKTPVFLISCIFPPYFMITYDYLRCKGVENRRSCKCYYHRQPRQTNVTGWGSG